MKANKYSLLQKDQESIYKEEEFYQQISMNRSVSETPYTQLQQDQDRHLKTKSIELTTFKPHQQPSASNLPQNQFAPNRSGLETSLPPRSIHSHFRNSPSSVVYSIPPQYNGSVLRVSNSCMTVHPRLPPAPTVQSTCPFCQTKQNIPSDTNQYYCCRCQKLNSIEPKLGYFICGVCLQKICYHYNTSDHIQCTLCMTINRVPLNPPAKKTESLKSKYKQEEKQVQSNVILPKQLREEEQPILREMENDEITTSKGELQQLQDFQK